VVDKVFSLLNTLLHEFPDFTPAMSLTVSFVK
jgi:hypothetical protein